MNTKKMGGIIQLVNDNHAGKIDDLYIFFLHIYI